MGAVVEDSMDTGFFGHPKGLLILFFTEMWERFSYYGMRAILVLYISASIDDGGLGWTKIEALSLYGWYTMMVYVMSIPGGYVADKILGQKKTVMLGGLLLVAGHLILAVDHLYAFYAGLVLIVLGVGGLKPNISTMVGGLYKKGDLRRDKGFTIFYMGINLGALIAGISVAFVQKEYGWHYGFGLAGLGMVLGQLMFMAGGKWLKGIGEFKGKSESATAVTAESAPLNKVEKDRMLVLFLSFLIIIVFWGAFEQAGGLLNIYAAEKVDRILDLGFWKGEIAAGAFQSVNSLFILIFGTAVAAFWVFWKKKGKESSSLFKMAMGTIIMGLGFLMMVQASNEAGAVPFGKASMLWLVLAYLLHTIGELCASPVALSFITKLAPVKYAAIMMGVYFAATGFGNKLAGLIGESAQTEPISILYEGNANTLIGYKENLENIKVDKGLSFRAKIYLDGDKVTTKDFETGKELKGLFNMKPNDEEHKDDETNEERLLTHLKEEKATSEHPLHATIEFSKDVEAKKIKANKGDGKNYEGAIRLMEVENKTEKNIFIFVAIFTVAFGLLLILFLKPLKKLTHGVEDEEV